MWYIRTNADGSGKIPLGENTAPLHYREFPVFHLPVTIFSGVSNNYRLYYVGFDIWVGKAADWQEPHGAPKTPVQQVRDWETSSKVKPMPPRIHHFLSLGLFWWIPHIAEDESEFEFKAIRFFNTHCIA